jgi:Nuclear protein Es2
MATQMASSDMQLMPPPQPRLAPRKLPPKPQQLVLEEDEWAEQLEAIIERDFFPDVPKLQSKLEWLQVCHDLVDMSHTNYYMQLLLHRKGVT